MTGRGRAEEQLLCLMDEVGRSNAPVDIGRHALRCLRRVLEVERASVLVFDDAGTMRFLAWEGLSEAYRRAVDGHSPWRPDERDAVPILVPDVAADPLLASLHEVFAREGIAALAFVPLRFGEQLLGKFMLYYPAPHAFDDEEIAFARVVAGHVAFALAHARVKDDLARRLETEQRARRRAEDENEERRRAEEHRELLLGAGHLLAGSLDMDTILAVLSGLLVPRFADWYAVHLVAPDGTIATAHLAHGDPDELDAVRRAVQRWPTRREPESRIARVLRTGEASLIEEVTPDVLAAAAQDEEHRQLLEDLGFRSAMVVPLRPPHGQPLGTITLITSESGRLYGPQDLAIAEALAGRAALAMDNARLYGEAERSRRAAEEAARRLSILLQTSERMAAQLEPDEALAQLARHAVVDLADYAVTYRLDDDGAIRRVSLAHADPARQSLVEQLVDAGPPRMDDAYGVGAVLRSGAPLLASEIPADLLESAAQNARHLEVLRQLEPVSSLVVPLVARGRTIGALALAATTRSNRRYSEVDLELAGKIASRAALLVDNARLYSAALAASRARDEVLAVVSHDLRSPLNTIVTACELLALETDDGRHARTHDSIRNAAAHMMRLLEALLDVTCIEEGRLQLARGPVDVRGLVSELVSLHGPVADGRAIRLGVDVAADVSVIDGDGDRLRQALSNLVDNALKFTPPGGVVRISAERHGSGVRITVDDTGPGIAAEQLPRLFDRFWRAQGASPGGVGLGLAIARGIAVAHGGELSVDSAPGQGARFTLVLPGCVAGGAAVQAIAASASAPVVAAAPLPGPSRDPGRKP